MILKNKAEEYFKKVCEIPHGTNHEAWLADYLEYFANEHQLVCHRDDMSNIIIQAPATKGYEDHEPLILQAHLDMICDVEPGFEFDFENRPLELIKKNGLYHAQHTTLGANSAVGVALILAILDDHRKHPALICVFNAQQANGLAGAIHLDQDQLYGKRMISFTGDHFGETTIASAGSRDVVLTRVLHPMENNDPAYKLSIYGLEGGYSGDDMTSSKANAAVVIARIFKYLISHGVDVRLARFEGGHLPNAIIMSAYAVFVSVTPAEDIERFLNEYFKGLETEYKLSDRHMEMKFEAVEWNDCYSGAETDALIQTIYLAPYGVLKYSSRFKNLPSVSLNLGIVSTQQHLAVLHYRVRAGVESEKDHICDQLITIGNIFNMSAEECNDVTKWRSHRISPLKKEIRSLYREMYHKNMKDVARHESLEVAVFQKAHPDMDIVTLAADIADPYTYRETLDLSSLKNLYSFLKKLLGEL